MFQQRRIGIAVSILVCFILQAQGADKYTDENRPYKFGFNVNVEGTQQQHRHEEKDKDGIIMGEFGFLTADDVYHVTVYATDKDGHFKILSMKNTHRKSSAQKGRTARVLSPVLPPSPAASAAPPVGPLQTQTPIKSVSLEPPGRSCSSCSIPTSTKVPPPSPNVVPPNQASPAFPPAPSYKPQQNFPDSPAFIPNDNRGPSPPFGRSPTQPRQPNQSFPESRAGAPIPNSNRGPSPPYEQGPTQPGQPNRGFLESSGGVPTPDGLGGPSPPFGNTPTQPEQNYSPGSKDRQGFRTSKQYNMDQEQSPVKPTLFDARMQIVDGNTDIHTLSPGEQRGLPPGLTKDDMTELLYTFNYTVGFHGHFEEGYRNGAKKGYYFVTGRNGVRTRIDYTADDTGFHPRVSQEVLDLLSDDVPKPETEKDEKYGLKGYEFKWLYYPVESSRQ